MISMIESRWINCPNCGGNTRTKVRADTVLYHQPVFCPKCKVEFLINAKKFQIELIKEPDAMTQSFLA
nr:cysteine-rich KTR domain-containing protein [uncultured Oscillibacter sp.]